VHEVRGWLAESLEAFDPAPSPRRAAARYWDGQLANAQARFAVADDDGAARLVAALVAAGNPVIEAVPDESRLERLFLEPPAEARP
jgi:hypothetical protein